MINISLPDGSVRSFDKPVSGADIAASIGPGLAKAALALRVDGKMKDLGHVVDHDAKIGIVTSRDPEALELLRHDAAHVLAQAVQELYPGTQITFGPATDDGFYYDFVREQPFSPEDFARIEQRMAEIVDRELPITREVWDRARIKDYFSSTARASRPQWADELPKDEEISVYKQGDWLDMCLGPHLPSTGKLGKAFKLTKVSGAYWRGDAKNAQLQRVYGTVFFSDKDLKAYLHRIEEAEKRDHRKLGPEMGLFHQQEDAAGMVYWHPKGWTLWRTLENYLRRKLEAGGYVEVKTPQLNDRRLWEKSGHWSNFRENMYLSENEEGLKEFVEDPARRMFALKPMNCPCHIQIFNQGLRSYRELPLRMAEMGSCHRFEPSGALHGILRVRAFTQDDAHIFCEGSQIEAETIRFCQLLESIYKDLGFPDYFVKFSDRPPTRIGSDAIWDQAEGALKSASKAAGRRPDPQSRRGRVLRPQAGIRAARCDRPRLAVRHAAGRLHAARAAGRELRRRGRQPQGAGHAAPRHLRQLRAHDRRS
jgi:threonyl-tRNA synthetase